MKLCPKCQKQFSSEANFCPVDAARLVPLPDGAPSDTLSTRYELGARLGGARTGAVHRATDKTTGGAVAIKLVAPNVVALPEVAQRLERELQQLEHVQSAGVAKLISSGKTGDEIWLAMELVEGAQTLAAAVGAQGPIAAPRAAEIVEAIGTALIDAAQAGAVHHDLAPKNVLLAGNHIKLINFSLPIPPTDKVPGVPEFVAPEQVEGRPVDQRSNLYSLGALYYYVLTGRPVFQGAPAAVHELHRTGTIDPPSRIAPNAVAPGSPLEVAIMRALERSPAKRFLTVRQFIDEVIRIGKDVAAAAQPQASAHAASTTIGVSEGRATPRPAPAPSASLGPAQTVLGMAPAPLPPGLVAQAAQFGLAPAPIGQGAATAQVSAAGAFQAPATASGKPKAIAAAVVAAPVVAASPVAAAAAAGKKKVMDAGSNPNKGKFRETLWFKKGDLDTQAAIAAADERARTGAEASGDHADSMPIDERYKDDGTLTHGDKERYSLRTGATQTLKALRPDSSAEGTNVSPDALIGEMKGGRSKVIAAVIAALVAIILIVAYAAR